MHPDSFAKKIDATTWGLLLLMTGVLLFMPHGIVPDGTWLLLAGAILLVMSGIRRMNGLAISAFVVALGILGIAAGLAEVAGVRLPLFAAFLVLVGASLALRPWIAREV